MKRRLLIATLALLLAAVGTSGLLSYVKGANARAIAGMRAVSVLVAQKQIPSGTTAAAALRNGLIASEKLPASSVPANALSSVPAALSSLVLSPALQPGQVLLRPMLVAAVQTTSGLAIPPGLMALTLDFCLPEVVAGAVQAGSEVAVFDTVGTTGQLSAVPGCTGTHGQVAGSNRTRVVLSRVEVLSAGTAPPAGQTGTATTTTFGGGSSSSSSQSGGSGTMVTLAVSQAQAERLIQLTETGMPYLALLSTSSRTQADIGNLLDVRPRPSPRALPTPTLPPLPLPTITPSPAPSPSQSPASNSSHHRKK
jgi:pilus assembly protein CpaB